jgi:energy-converting hydrogenase B subunit Q
MARRTFPRNDDTLEQPIGVCQDNHDVLRAIEECLRGLVCCAIRAISEADRYNIRGEHISVDTVPLGGEQSLADAVRACGRLPLMKALVLAGSVMGGDIERAVREVRAQGLVVVSLNTAGSVPAAADLVVSDPLQAGVVTVMAVAETARFSLARLKHRSF